MSSTPISDSVSDSSTPGDGQTRLRVGRLTKAHGLKGALKVELYTDAPKKRFVPGAVFALQVPNDSPWHGKTLELVELRWYNSHPVGFFVGVDDRTAAETLVKAILWVEHEGVEVSDEPDAWFDHQLIGLSVVRDGSEVGTIARVDHLPAQDLLAVDTPSGEVLVPFVSAIVPSVDLAAGTVTVTPPLGLFESLDDDEPADAEVPATAVPAPAARDPKPDETSE
ncbi:16S rRNA processing protein RimM [Frondihabitans sp. PhB188]|uniref:ribosome maturation factor RimM n=1 Tax=Frondihabitans sp. PhB188 TaxID=2485200 RepID=UPI000F49DAAE|nr:ribosome maturation factor RimM [Frondihabitans sp. PhB188]ROQ41416.1 16S rRNA processing protein RimM [Frondihabitans sp. PhB188]